MKLLVVFFCFLLNPALYASTEEPVKNFKNFNVRVLLAKKDLLHDVSQEAPQEVFWVLGASQGFLLTDGNQPEIQEVLEAPQLIITYAKNSLYINNKRLASDKIKIDVLDNKHIDFNGNCYQGSFLLVKANQVIYLINSVDLEDYVYSVLRWESWPGWPLEVNKAFAITCRTYVVAKVLEARNKKRAPHKRLIYDIQCTNIHQTYKGTHTFNKVYQAVDETRGIIMAHNKKPIIAMYDSCCGGVTPAKLSGIDFVGAPYLARDYPCTYCSECKLYAWCVNYDMHEFEKLIKTKKSARIRDIKISKKDRAGIVQEIKIKTGNNWSSLTGKEVYSAFKDIKSLCFSVTYDNNKIIFKGRGYGHHIGMCQWGARQMVKEGWDYKSILHFYYPKINFMRVEVV